MVPKVKGTQDVLDLTLYNFLFAQLNSHLTNYGYSQIATPILEPLELFQRSLGQFTEVVTKEMYLVTTKQPDGSLQEPTICLRPEGTASTMRAFFTNNIDQRPWKVFAHGPMFRHERPQKGRYRQFNQATIEAIGAESSLYDAELIAMLDQFFSEKLKIDSYALLINFLGSPQDRAHYKTVLADFLDKQTDLPKKIIDLKDKNILRIFDLKDEACQAVLKNAPVITDHLSDESQKEWTELKQILDQLSVSYSIEPRLVRGLDYYNKTVFEFVSSALGAQSTFCGGGRYDYLSQELGEKEAVPSIGAAFGVERIVMILEEQNSLTLPNKPALQVILPLGEQEKKLALLCADELRAHGICCEALYDAGSVKSMMRKANKMGAQHVLLIGADELANNYVTVKNMTTSSEQQVKQGDLVNFFTK